MKSGRLVVRHHSPFGGRIAQIGLLVLAVLVGAGLYYLGQYTAGYNVMKSREVQAEFESIVNELQADKATLRDRVALIEQSAQVDQQAYQQVKDNLRSLQQENLELREEVSFYRGIVAPGESSAGIRVDRLKIEKVDDNGLFHFKFVLTQVLNNDKPIRGTVKLAVDGVVNGLPKSLGLTDLSVEKQNQLEFNFKYFQRFEGDLLLPKGFTPRQVQIDVNPFKKKNIKSTIDWPSAAAKLPTDEQLDAGNG